MNFKFLVRVSNYLLQLRPINWIKSFQWFQAEIDGLQRTLNELEAQSQRMDTYISQLNADLQEQQVIGGIQSTIAFL